ncbi:MAG: hypothetical protein QOF53_3237 [Nocardioidaceae bacterium]|nr:hypothetical protein [Nocardioidaceae bacterium]
MATASPQPSRCAGVVLIRVLGVDDEGRLWARFTASTNELTSGGTESWVSAGMDDICRDLTQWLGAWEQPTH